MTKLLCAKILSIAMLFVYVSSFYTIYPAIGNTLLIISIVPVLLTCWAFNLYYAIVVQFILIAHRFVAMHILQGDYEVMTSLSTFLGTCLNFVLLFTVDHLCTLNKKLKVVEQKLIQQNTELIITKNKAEESDRLKSTFIANISHEIRTPLNAIIGFSHLLMEPNIKQADKQEFFRNIKCSGDRLMQQIDSYIEMSNLMASQPPLLESAFCLGEVMEDLLASAIAQVKDKGKECIDLYIHGALDKGEDKVIADRNKLTQILQVLIDNAIKFTNKGYVKICYKINHETELMFSVEDTGIGISSQYKEIIFDCFRQGDEGCYSRKYEGSGLGLAISKASVELLGGKIWFTSAPGKGSTFFFTIPYKPVLHKKNMLDMKFLTTN